MQASGDRCRSAIFDSIVIGPLRIEWRGTGGKIGFDHVGEDGARLGKVESGDGRVKRLLHAGLPEILVAPQEFGVDGADLVERRAQPAEVVEELGDLAMDGLRHIGLPRTMSGGADRQIVFWPVADPVGAMAARTTAASVGFHERAAEHTCERGNLRHEPAATLAQNCGRDVLHSERVQKMTDPIVVPAESSINPRRAATQNRLDEACERDEAGPLDDDRLDGRRHPCIRGRPIGPLSAHGEAAKIGMPEAQRLDPRNSSKLQDDKPLAPQWMKRMRNFSRAQRLTGAKCSSMGVWRRSGIGWSRPPPSSCWNRSSRRTSRTVPTVTAPFAERWTRSRKCTGLSAGATRP